LFFTIFVRQLNGIYKNYPEFFLSLFTIRVIHPTLLILLGIGYYIIPKYLTSISTGMFFFLPEVLSLLLT